MLSGASIKLCICKLCGTDCNMYHMIPDYYTKNIFYFTEVRIYQKHDKKYIQICIDPYCNGSCINIHINPAFINAKYFIYGPINSKRAKKLHKEIKSDDYFFEEIYHTLFLKEKLEKSTYSSKFDELEKIENHSMSFTISDFIFIKKQPDTEQPKFIHTLEIGMDFLSSKICMIKYPTFVANHRRRGFIIFLENGECYITGNKAKTDIFMSKICKKCKQIPNMDIPVKLMNQILILSTCHFGHKLPIIFDLKKLFMYMEG